MFLPVTDGGQMRIINSTLNIAESSLFIKIKMVKDTALRCEYNWEAKHREVSITDTESTHIEQFRISLIWVLLAMIKDKELPYIVKAVSGEYYNDAKPFNTVVLEQIQNYFK